MREKFILGISGASSVGLGVRFLQALPQDLDIYVILTQHAQVVFEKEHQNKPDWQRQITILDSSDIGAGVASGSFNAAKMAIIPTSMNTLAKIACGIADCLLTRAAGVMIKESRPLLLAPRELPLSAIALENMLKLSRLGIIIAPPILGYYAQSETLQDMENFLIGKWLDALKIPNNLYKRWK